MAKRERFTRASEDRAVNLMNNEGVEAANIRVRNAIKETYVDTCSEIIRLVNKQMSELQVKSQSLRDSARLVQQGPRNGVGDRDSNGFSRYRERAAFWYPELMMTQRDVYKPLPSELAEIAMLDARAVEADAQCAGLRVLLTELTKLQSVKAADK